MSISFYGTGNIGATNDVAAVKFSKKLSVSDQVWTQPYPVGHPLSIGGCMSWVDYHYSQPNKADPSTQYTVVDLATEGLPWHARGQNSGSWQNSHIRPMPETGTKRVVMRTGSSGVGGGVIANQGRRPDWKFGNSGYMNHTWVFWVWRNPQYKNSAESLATIYAGTVGTNYEIIRAYNGYWDFYNESNTANQLTSTNTGGYADRQWHMFTFTAYQDSTFQVGIYDAANPNGAFDIKTGITNNWTWGNETTDSVIVIGGSTWSPSSGEGWGAGAGTGSADYGAIGAHMLYNSALSRSTTKSIFDFYKGEFGIA